MCPAVRCWSRRILQGSLILRGQKYDCAVIGIEGSLSLMQWYVLVGSWLTWGISLKQSANSWRYESLSFCNWGQSVSVWSIFPSRMDICSAICSLTGRSSYLPLFLVRVFGVGIKNWRLVGQLMKARVQLREVLWWGGGLVGGASGSVASLIVISVSCALPESLSPGGGCCPDDPWGKICRLVVLW